MWEADLSSLPSLPGVYWFLDKNGRVLYVGKAKILKNRVRSYTRHKQLSNRIKQMVATATQIKFKVLQSELEALLIEAQLIGTYQPKFNVLLKDDKSPLYINITNEKFPRVLKIRKKEIINNYGNDGKLQGTILGPFSSAYKVKEVLKIARKIFPWCNLKNSEKKPCFYYQIDLCPGACVEEISQQKYKENIKELILFLKGKKQIVFRNLRKKMNEKIQKEEFEDAGVIRDQLKMIEIVTQKNHSLKPESTTPALKNRINEDGIIYLQKILSEFLKLPKQFPLTRIEGYDVSNTQGTNSAVAMVTFINGLSTSSEYKVFNIHSLNTPNDYQMIKEAILRRQNHPKWGKPNLVIIDGGKGQVRSALQAWNWNIPIIGIAKNPDRLILPNINETNRNQSKTNQTSNLTNQNINKTSRNINLKNLKYHVLNLDKNHPALKLVQQVRDEAHRFSKRQHKKRRLKNMFK